MRIDNQYTGIEDIITKDFFLFLVFLVFTHKPILFEFFRIYDIVNRILKKATILFIGN